MTRSSKSLQIKKRKKILFYTKTYLGRKKNCFKLSKQYFIKSLEKKYKNIKIKKRILNKKKTTIINILFRIYFGISYNKVICLLKKNYCIINKLKIIFLLLKLII
ncbi:50S ribosomal protein L20 [Candidatus Carsonella ruddii]|uniref:Large ribosomal subunit protein bL20 n=1 Tax=Candidatus Carsonella ruddii HC isolate Thao2000 TaxID=1202538 RepID=J3VPW5_CARRU|nr:50S ribosomal protein L20 [Candidatus Carsonella ruddii]AFP83956.1 ribosomal protein L20 [Candidatus Carsonella ruddii HC isolate Thao2000]